MEPAEVPAAASLPRISPLRSASVVFGTALGLCFGFTALLNASLPFFLLPWSQEFGWGRGQVAAATVLAMLGVTLASPFTGRLFDRFGTERVIALSVPLFAAAIYALSHLHGSLALLGALCLLVGVFGSGTSMVGYAGVLPKWFDRRLGLALGLGGLGAGVGVGIAPFVATRLIERFGWRGALVALAALALAGGLLAVLLIRPRAAERPRLRSHPAPGSAAAEAVPGVTFAAARRDRRFWLLLAITFTVPFAVLGIALHGAALFIDRGLSAQQAAAGAALAGLGAVAARLGVGVLLDRWRAPHIACVVFAAAACGLALNSGATSFGLLCIGTFLGGAAMGAEGDLLPFMIRRWFGLRAFGSLFGVQFAAYALGGVLGPIAYGYTHDRLGTYAPMMLAGAAACLACAAAVLAMGPHRYGAERARA